MTGQTVGDYRVIKRLENAKRGDARWECECALCGEKSVKTTYILLRFREHVDCPEKEKLPDPRCKSCFYWRYLDPANVGIKACHYCWETGHARKRDEAGCYEFLGKGGKSNGNVEELNEGHYPEIP